MTHPQTTSEWFELYRKQLRGEAEPVVEPDYEDDDQYPKRRDWE